MSLIYCEPPVDQPRLDDYEVQGDAGLFVQRRLSDVNQSLKNVNVSFGPLYAAFETHLEDVKSPADFEMDFMDPDEEPEHLKFRRTGKIKIRLKKSKNLPPRPIDLED